MSRPNLRKRMFVSRPIQGRLLTRIASYWVVYHIVIWHTLFLFRWGQYRLEIMMGGTHLSFAELYGSFAMQYYPIVLTALATAPLLMWDVLRLTHGIAGPLVAFKNALHKLREGEHVESVRLRKDDLLSDFRDEFNEFLDFYNAQLRSRTDAQTNAAAVSSDEELQAQIDELQQATTVSAE